MRRYTLGPPMLPDEPLLTRIRGEFREMPGLRLTVAEACRLWQVDVNTCERVLHTLLTDQFLLRTATGAFMACPLASERRPMARAESPRQDQRQIA
jgi:hypothetical protein